MWNTQVLGFYLEKKTLDALLQQESLEDKTHRNMLIEIMINEKLTMKNILFLEILKNSPTIHCNSFLCYFYDPQNSFTLKKTGL